MRLFDMLLLVPAVLSSGAVLPQVLDSSLLPAMPTVSEPGVSLSQTNQSVYRTMAVNVTATLGGCATGGAWTSSGTGSFSSTNDLTTVYTPSAAEAGTTVTLKFTTTEGGTCGVATAVDVVTFNQNINPAKTILIKCDDFRGPSLEWSIFLKVTRALGVKVGIGVICSNSIDPHRAISEPAAYQSITNWMQTQEARGDVEFWNHGWVHAYWTNANAQTIFDYSGVGLATESNFLAMSQAALSRALGRDVIAFGAPYNKVDTNTAAAINAEPALKLVFDLNPTDFRKYGLNPGAALVKIIKETDGTGMPNAARFEAAYPGGPTGPVSLQFHPLDFDPVYLRQFQHIIQYLQSNGYSFLLPSEYVAAGLR
jgi:peptidoglycan/xylan/chitin deacetylase (PgdA/CDA1 family)